MEGAATFKGAVGGSAAIGDGTGASITVNSTGHYGVSKYSGYEIRDNSGRRRGNCNL